MDRQRDSLLQLLNLDSCPCPYNTVPFSHPSFADLSSTLPLLLIMTIILNTLVSHYSHPASFKVIKYFYGIKKKKKKFLEGEQLQSLFDTSKQQSSHTKKTPNKPYLSYYLCFGIDNIFHMV